MHVGATCGGAGVRTSARALLSTADGAHVNARKRPAVTFASLTGSGQYVYLWALSQVTHDTELCNVCSVLLCMGDTLSTFAFSATAHRVI